MKDDLQKYPNPMELRDQVLRTQELIFDFTKRIMKLKKDLNLFKEDLK
ncbi:MAG: hypothetical protein HC880_00155 [Bacteroidia bacterium]|nr:hypothetical protein [Bacteroidia bacterium]